jgi:dephospho-CoA kinase
MIKVALVGNIASGKSTAEEYLKDLGYPVLDTDKVCHNLLEELSEVKEAFALYDIFHHDKISRQKLGHLVFTDPKLRKILEDILYPHVKMEIAKFFAQNISSKYAFVGAPMLFEAKMEDLFDKILFVYADDNIRLERLMKREGYSKQYAQIRLDVQGKQEDKVVKSDWVVYNNSTVSELKTQISKLIV